MLRLSPDAFWAMTPRDLAAAVRGVRPAGRGGGPSRADLAALMARYPDGAA
ncbi:phage tail assembly chaperone [Mongoliimonas terrestris]|uniref:phage tail assembly chaperone n=1 Tax=Mongoliimonas terrestris TaxID=1709001 RepID=UPI0009498896|nr:phage tail assembly chaperone [Mongoliimonas terrestris]